MTRPFIWLGRRMMKIRKKKSGKKAMNPYPLAYLIAFALLLVLSLAAIFLNPRDKGNRLLFALCLNLALSVGAALPAR